MSNTQSNYTEYTAKNGTIIREYEDGSKTFISEVYVGPDRKRMVEYRYNSEGEMVRGN